jgi:ABC-type transporter Mla subunit MlaD
MRDRLTRVEEAVKNLAERHKELEGTVRQLHQIAESSSRLIAETTRQFQDLQIQARDALQQVNALQLKLATETAEDDARASERARMFNWTRIGVATAFAVLSLTSLASKGLVGVLSDLWRLVAFHS